MGGRSKQFRRHANPNSGKHADADSGEYTDTNTNANVNTDGGQQWGDSYRCRGEFESLLHGGGCEVWQYVANHGHVDR